MFLFSITPMPSSYMYTQAHRKLMNYWGFIYWWWWGLPPPQTPHTRKRERDRLRQQREKAARMKETIIILFPNHNTLQE